MAEISNKIGALINNDDKLLDIWARRNPKFEKKFEQSVMKVISDYGVGASENTSAKVKSLELDMSPILWPSL